MKIVTFYHPGSGWDYMVINSEGINIKPVDSYWYQTEEDAVSNAKACYPDITEFILSDSL